MSDEIQNRIAQGTLVVVPVTLSREIHIQISEYKGKPVLDIRTYVKSATYTGYTQKGINVPKDKGKEILEALEKILKGAK